ncbi:MAG: sulfite exporter TauE/SafE family protein [Dehalococcoidales bacterium]|nr:sulfite exporter TauE/SafE family protein [Dehalococcoidales bacterium]
MPIIDISILAAAGLFAGIFGTMIGIGGGIIFVPLFLLVFQYTPQQAIGTSLMAVFFNALSGSFAYLRQRRVDIKAGLKFAVATLPGALLGAWLARFFTPLILELVFGILLIVVAVFILWRGEPRPQNTKQEGHTRTLIDFQGEAFYYHPKEGRGIVISFGIGIVSSLLGIGGGIVHVPALNFLLDFPIHIATATSHFVLAISTFFGSGAHIIFGNVLIVPAIIVAAFAIPGAQIGARLSRRTKGYLITRLLAVALLLVGIRLLLKSLGIF